MIGRLLNKIPVSEKFRNDTIWNFVSLGLFGITGLIISFTISKFYSPEILGIFNINFAILMILSQLAGAGIHYSVLHKISKFSEDVAQQKLIISSGILAVVISASLIVSISFMNLDLFNVLFDKRGNSSTVLNILPAVLLLAINKVLLSFFNGRRAMKIFASANIMRSVVLLTSSVIFINANYQPENIAVIFSITELSVFILFIIIISKHLTLSINLQYISSHFSHGLKSLWGTIFLDIYTKVDIIMIGLFLNDFSVGIYTLPALIVEGYQQLPLVLRNVINPVLTQSYTNKGKAELENIVRQGIRLTYRVLVPVGILLCLFFPVAVWALSLDESYFIGILPLIILLTGVTASSGYLPFITIFNQLGLPKTQSLFFFLIFASNVILNAILIPLFEINGAALATSISFIVTLIFLKTMLLRKIQITI